MICPLCPLCKRDIQLTQHHVVPRNFGGKEKISICKDCHNAIHARYSNKELKEKFFTLELLMVDSDLQKAYKFFGKQSYSKRFSSKQSNKRGKKGKYG